MEEDTSQGFYEIGGYRQNVRRYKDGIEQVNELHAMFKDRAEIEAVYIKSLGVFHSKWNSNVSRFGSAAIRSICTSVLDESLEIQKLHNNVRDRICEELLKTVGLYLKENHHTATFRNPKEIREMEDDFEKAQRPWRKQFEKAEKAKKAFHLASKAEKSAQIQLKNAGGDPSISSDGENKYRERWQKCNEELEKSEKKYQSSINELLSMKDNYVAHMQVVFEACQQKELKRLKFAFEMLSGFQKVLADLAAATKLNSMHRRLESELNKVDTQFRSELDQWSNKFGPGSSMKWPQFEAYIPPLHTIASKKEKSNESQVVLTRKIVKVEDDRNSIISSGSKQNNENSTLKNFASASTSNNHAMTNDEDQSHSFERPNQLATTSDVMTESVSDAITYGNNFDELPYKEVVLYQAKVCYDYDAQDNDELTLVKGELIDVLGEPDRLNWSFGRKEGRTGVFPAKYVERVD